MTLAMIAQFIPRKGHRVLIEALPAIVARHPNVRVLLFGRGAEQAAIRRAVAARPELASRVAFAGFRDDLHRVLPCIDVVVHPASMEGLGVALLQAAACGVPIVAGRAGGIPHRSCHVHRSLGTASAQHAGERLIGSQEPVFVSL